MGFLDKIFGKKPAPAATTKNSQLVRIDIPLLDDGFGSEEERERFLELDEDLQELLDGSPYGLWDGHEIGCGIYSIWLYGPSAQRLSDFVRPISHRSQRAQSSSFGTATWMMTRPAKRRSSCDRLGVVETGIQHSACG